jgi:hypothetical protein
MPCRLLARGILDLAYLTIGGWLYRVVDGIAGSTCRHHSSQAFSLNDYTNLE